MTWLKRILAPSGQKVELAGARTWLVRWTGRQGAYHAEKRPEVQAFLSKEDAEHFARELRTAFLLLKHTGDGTEVSVSEQD